jgi:hypothetical protein
MDSKLTLNPNGLTIEGEGWYLCQKIL